MRLRLRLRPEATKANAPITGGIGSMVDAVVWNALRQARSYPGVFGTTSAPKNTPGVRFIRKGRQKMLTIEKVIELLQAEYEKAKK